MPPDENNGLQQEANNEARATIPIDASTQDLNSGVTGRGGHASGRGEVRSEHDGRLQDNLSREQRSEIGRKGGMSVSQNREHMAAIGRKGGEAVSRNREHMAAIGRKGGEAVSQDRSHMSAIGREGGRA